MTHWTIVLTNLSKKRANYREILVLLRLRWQIERLFRLWKEDGKIDEWRGKSPYRIVCELYAKLCAMVLPQSLLQEGVGSILIEVLSKPQRRYDMNVIGLWLLSTKEISKRRFNQFYAFCILDVELIIELPNPAPLSSCLTDWIGSLNCS